MKPSMLKACALLLVAFALTACNRGLIPTTPGVHMRLSGAEEVPPVNTSAQGKGTVLLQEDRTLTGTFSVEGLAPIAAHIHEGAPGQNGPVIIPLTRVSDSEWVVPAGTKLTDAQYASYRAGRLYVNFHTTQNKGGEISGQIRPSGGLAGPGGY